MISNSLGAMPRGVYASSRRSRTSGRRAACARGTRAGGRCRSRSATSSPTSSARRTARSRCTRTSRSPSRSSLSCFEFDAAAQQGRLHGHELPVGDVRLRGAEAARRAHPHGRRATTASPSTRSACSTRSTRRRCSSRSRTCSSDPRSSRTPRRSARRRTRSARTWSSTSTRRPARCPSTSRSSASTSRSAARSSGSAAGRARATSTCGPTSSTKLEPALTGWEAHPRPFAFETGPIRYADDQFRFLNGTPHVPALFAATTGLRDHPRRSASTRSARRASGS